MTPIPSTSTSTTGPRLRAALLALGAALLVTAAGMQMLNGIVHKNLSDALVNPLAVKDLGVWLQKEAFAKPTMLPVYGSSELTDLQMDNEEEGHAAEPNFEHNHPKAQPGRTEEVFASSPTGFQVCPVGAPGHTTLLMAAKLGGLKDSPKGRKVVIILSPSWFRRAGALPEQVAGCLSPLQAFHFVRNRSLSADIKQRFAARLLEYPGAVEPQPVLEVYLKGVAGRATVAGWALMPLVKTCEAGLTWEDHLAVGCVAAFETNWKNSPETLPLDEKHEIAWRSLIEPIEKAQAAEGEPEIHKVHSKQSPEDANAEFIASYEGGKEWDDLKLLLDTMKDLDMKPLLLAVPLGGNGLETHGITRESRDHFHQHLREVCAPYGWPLLDFAEHDMDPGFLKKGTSHFTTKGWLYVNWTIDDFYHDRPIESGVVHQGREPRS